MTNNRLFLLIVKSNIRLILVTYILSCVLFSCNPKDKKQVAASITREIQGYENDAMNFIDSIEKRNLVNESKWKIYLKYCEKMIVQDEFGKKLDTPYYFGESEVYLREAHIEGDTLLAMLFIPTLYDTIQINYSCFEGNDMKFKFFNSHYYVLKEDRFYGYGYENGILIDSVELNDFCNGLIKCDKSSFISKNRRLFNDWFISEAIRRGIIYP